MTSHRRNMLLVVCILLSVSALAARSKKQSEEADIIDTYGENYMAYRQGRLAEESGDYQQAIQHYKTVSGGSMLGDAAAVYSSRCYSRLGRWSEALQMLEDHLRTRDRSTYTFEAHLLLAQLQYAKGAGSKEALQLSNATISKALELMAEIQPANQEEWRRKRNLPALLLLLQDQDPNEKAKDDFSVDTPLALPGTPGWPGAPRIVNRETCEWYLTWVHAQLNLFSAFLALEAGDTERAQNLHSAARAILPLQNDTAQVYLNRIAYCLQRGGWLYPANVRARFNNFGAHLRLGAYLLISGYPEDALPYFETVSKDRHPTLEEAGAAIFARIAALQQLHRGVEALPLLTDNEKLLKKVDLYDSAYLLCQLAW